MLNSSRALEATRGIFTSILAKTCRNYGKTANSKRTTNLQAASKTEQPSITGERQLHEDGFARQSQQNVIFPVP
jgi:hypothetical protein